MLGAVTVIVAVAVFPEAVSVTVIVTGAGAKFGAAPEAKLSALTSPPEAVTLAAAGLDEANVSPLVSDAVLPSLYVPFTLSCWVAPMLRDTDAGVTAIDTSAGLVTVTDAEAVLPELVAVMVAVPPTVPAVTSPAADTVATPAAELAETAKLDVLVKFFVDASL